MRIRRSVTRFFGRLVIPSLSAAVVAYFGYYTVFGARGLESLYDTNARLSVQQEQLASLKDQHAKLAHRIRLLEPGSVDPDMVEEVAREQMLDSAPNEVAVPRATH
jgi:cell division protein FtsB